MGAVGGLVLTFWNRIYKEIYTEVERPTGLDNDSYFHFSPPDRHTNTHMCAHTHTPHTHTLFLFWKNLKHIPDIMSFTIKYFNMQL